MSILNIPKTARFFCQNCEYKTDNKKDYIKHLATLKHINLTNITDLSTENPQKSQSQQKEFKCKNCGNTYKGRDGLWRHSIVELAKNSGNNYNNTNNINSNNKFNLNVFLNEQCKDAMNISDFVSSLVVSVKDLEETAKLGYSEGISKIFLNGLQELDTHYRPLHCSDSKREILYIKDQDKWEKENEGNEKIIKAIKTIAHKNMKMIPEWIKENPDYNDSSSKTNDKYLKLVMNSMSGSTEEEQKKNINKIISNVAKEVVINK